MAHKNKQKCIFEISNTLFESIVLLNFFQWKYRTLNFVKINDKLQTCQNMSLFQKFQSLYYYIIYITLD